VRNRVLRTRPIDRLRALPLLRGVGTKELARIDRLTDEVDIAEGRVVTREGERARGFFLIVSGRALVTVAGRERGMLDAGMFFGEAAVVDDAPEPATISALTPMRLRVATRHGFSQLVVMPPFARALLQSLAAYERLAYDDGASTDSFKSGKLSPPSDETSSGGSYDRQVGVHG